MNILNEQLIAEELAAICVIPQNVVDDTEYDIWGAVKPELAKAIARAYDAACIFGVNAPTTFPPRSSRPQRPRAMSSLATCTRTRPTTRNSSSRPPRLVATQGYNVSAAAVGPGWEFRTAATRTTALTNNPVGDTMFPLILAGMPIRAKPSVLECGRDRLHRRHRGRLEPGPGRHPEGYHA